MRHAFVPMTNGSDRCAKCLRHLDCSPHLPVAQSPWWPISVERDRLRAFFPQPVPELPYWYIDPATRRRISSGSQRPGALRRAWRRRAPVVSRAVR